MSGRLLGFCWILALFGLLLVQATAESYPPAGNRASAPPSRVDPYGDPLPEAACYRVGQLPFWCGPETNFIAFARDGKTLLSGDEHAKFTVWDMTTGRAIRQSVVPVYHKDEPAPFNGPLAALSPDGRLLAVDGIHRLDSETDEHVALVDVGTGKVVQKLAEGDACRRLTFSRDGKVLAALQGAGAIRCWRMPGGKSTGPIIHSPTGLDTIALSPDGKLLAGGDRDAFTLYI